MIQKRALVMGGSRFFGRHLTALLVESGYDVTVLNRGSQNDSFDDRVKRIVCDRTNIAELATAIKGLEWDLVFDQICFTAPEARAICKLLEGRVERLVFTSSQSVYEYGFSVKESDFDPFKHRFSKEVTAAEDYGEAKRQAESEFSKYSQQLNPVMVRLPFVIGLDDYTHRLQWHIERCKKELPIFFPNETARLGFIRSDFAGQSLLKISESSLKGPVNCASTGDIEIQSLMKLIEEATGKSFIRAKEKNTENHSPYGLKQSWTMNLEKLTTAEIRTPELLTWLPDLIAKIAANLK